MSKKNFATVDAPGATMTQVLGLNNSGRLVGFYLDSSGASHGFVKAGRRLFQSLDDPDGVGTTVINGVNADDDLVGFYVDAAGNTDGFEASPGRS
jgi:hypothetical protein